MEENNKNANSPRQIKLADNIPGAEYANAMQVSFNKEEMQMIFMNLFAGSGRIASKLITSPGHFKRIINAMTEAMKKYENQFGEVEKSEAPNSEIGFKS